MAEGREGKLLNHQKSNVNNMLACSVLSLLHFLKIQRKIITSFLIAINGLLSYCLGLISNGNNVQFCFVFFWHVSPQFVMKVW